VPLVSVQKSVTLKGKFNPYIVSPEWLKSAGIWEANDIKLNLGMAQDGVQFSSASKGTEWSVSYSGLSVASRLENCGELAARVVEKLPHTPITSVNASFGYACSASDWDGPLPKIGDLDRSSVDSSRQPIIRASWHGTFLCDAGELAVMLADSRDNSLIVLLSYDRPSSCWQNACDFARRFNDDEVAGKTLIKHLFKKDISDELVS
jgi:hypothetical protein